MSKGDIWNLSIDIACIESYCFKALCLMNYYIVNVNTLIYTLHVSLYSIWCFVIKCHRGHQQTKWGRMSLTRFGCVCRCGVIFKKLGIRSLMLASKPVSGFKNSIQVHDYVYLSASSVAHYITLNVQMM